MRKPLVTFLIALLLPGLLCSCNTTDGNEACTQATGLQTDTVAGQQTEETSEQPGNVPMQEIECYENPVLTAASPDAWEDYGFGDPFVMRYNGRYYLYVSTLDGQVGIKCWTSDDLIHWTYAGLCATDARTRGAYAPEVYYYNGYFYMYTSPAGNGHFVLRSTSPTEGFEVVSDNLGMSIDGSVFIDRDGKWYFYTANHGEMMVYDMSSPTSMRKGRELASVSVNGAWTEGPMTVYHDGYYYMTYTGNHVLSRSYRINYAVSATSSCSFAGLPVSNPLLIHTMGDLFGIGHSSTVKGPDLDSYYIVYHSLVTAKPQRNTHVDRIVFNGESMQIMGPTIGKQQVPEMPDVYHRFEAGDSLQGWQLQGSFGTVGSNLPLAADSQIVSEQGFAGDFTAEYNVTYVESGAQAGALFAYTDSANYGACCFDPAQQSLCIETVVNGVVTTEYVALVKSFGEDVRFDCLQTLQIERSGNTYTFYVNDRLAHQIETDALKGGSIGYVTRNGAASFGFIGGTGAVGGRGAADVYHSIGSESGLIPAQHSLQGDFERVQKQGVWAVVCPEGSVLDYRVLAEQGGSYDLAVRYATPNSTPVTLEIFVDAKAVGSLTLDPSKTLCTAVCRDVPLSAGQHTLSFRIVNGSAEMVEIRALTHADVPVHAWSFEKPDDGSVYSDGNWRATGSISTSRTPICAKRLYGNQNWGDYATEVSVTPQEGVNCGLVVRASNPGAPNFMHQKCTTEEAADGTDWLQGYFVGIVGDGVVLGKQNYSYSELARASGTYTEGNTYELRAECRGANIRVFVDGALVLEYTDPDPYIQGMVGLRTYQSSAKFADLRIYPIE